MSWLILILAGLLEIAWAALLKQSEGMTRLLPATGAMVLAAASLALLAVALRNLPLGTAYAVWTGVGTAGTALTGMLLFNEPATPLRLLCIGAIILGIAGLKAAP